MVQGSWHYKKYIIKEIWLIAAVKEVDKKSPILFLAPWRIAQKVLHVHMSCDAEHQSSNIKIEKTIWRLSL